MNRSTRDKYVVFGYGVLQFYLYLYGRLVAVIVNHQRELKPPMKVSEHGRLIDWIWDG